MRKISPKCFPSASCQALHAPLPESNKHTVRPYLTKSGRLRIIRDSLIFAFKFYPT